MGTAFGGSGAPHPSSWSRTLVLAWMPGWSGRLPSPDGEMSVAGFEMPPFCLLGKPGTQFG